MTKQQLNNLFYLKREIAQLNQQLKVLESGAESCTAQITGMPHGSGVNLKIEKYAVQIATLKDTINERICEAIDEYVTLNTYINSLSDSYIRQILRYRYVDGYNWRKIAFKMGGNNTEDSIKQTHCRFLKTCHDCHDKV